MYVGLVLFIIGLTVEVRGIPNQELLLLSSGLFFIGLGEWKNHKTAACFKEANACTGGPGLMQAKVRSPDVIGLLLDGAGFLLMALGGGHLMQRVWLV
jgi:hypothetical protein